MTADAVVEIELSARDQGFIVRRRWTFQVCRHGALNRGVNRGKHPPGLPRRSGGIGSNMGQTQPQVSEDAQSEHDSARHETKRESSQGSLFLSPLVAPGWLPAINRPDARSQWYSGPIASDFCF